MRVDDIIEKLSVEELVGQLLCFDFYGKDDPNNVYQCLFGGFNVTKGCSESVAWKIKTTGKKSRRI